MAYAYSEKQKAFNGYVYFFPFRSQIVNPSAYPLAWPAGRPRTPTHHRKDGKFKANGGALTVAKAADRVAAELTRLGAIYGIMSSNLEVRLDGRPRSGQRNPDDPGVCVYFQLSRKPYAMACDRYRTVADNLAAIAAHIEATRAITRHGVASAEETLQAFQALPAPAAESPSRAWWEVLGVASRPAISDVDAAYRRLAVERHPDRGGSEAAMAELNAAREAARRALAS
jgi:hypothetical protein